MNNPFVAFRMGGEEEYYDPAQDFDDSGKLDAKDTWDGRPWWENPEFGRWTGGLGAFAPMAMQQYAAALSPIPEARGAPVAEAPQFMDAGEFDVDPALLTRYLQGAL
jgi:hypothetical protein